jgi:transposase
MKRFVEGVARDQGGLFPSHLEDFVGEDNPVRAVDAFVEMLDLRSASPLSMRAPLGGQVIIPPFC